MKKTFLTLGLSAVAAVSLFTSCKENTQVEVVVPIVSISADSEFASDNTATLTLTLSEATSGDVSVTLADADVQSGIEKVAAIYSKNVTIEAGKTSVTVDVQADVLGLESGEYQTAIRIASAEGAEVAENSVVYIGFNYVERPSVELYSEVTDVPASREFNLLVRLSAAYTEDVTVTLADGADSNVPAIYEKNVTVSAGETEVQVPVTVNTDGLEPGNYKVVIDLISADNAVVGSAKSASVNLAYPFNAEITIDGLFDDWDMVESQTYTCPDNAKYPVVRTLKLAANSRDVYVYFEFEAPENYGFAAFDNNNIPYNFYIDPDGNAATGAYVGTIDNDTAGQPFDPMGFTYYVEAALRDGTAEPFTNFYSSTIYRADCTVDGGFFWTSDVTLVNLAGTYTGEDIYGTGTYEGGLARIEVKLSRSFFGITGTSFRFALKLMDGQNNWKAMGLLPQGPVDADGNFVPVDLGVISLPEYAE